VLGPQEGTAGKEGKCFNPGLHSNYMGDIDFQNFKKQILGLGTVVHPCNARKAGK
jgi:hypothetical protein